MPNLCDKESYDCNDLIKIVGILRSPEGCPWDRAQDHHTIRNNFLEEAYEAVEAIDLESSALLREACRTPIHYRETLITDGLHRIWLRNRKG